jgi:hypothetical protein
LAPTRRSSNCAITATASVYIFHDKSAWRQMLSELTQETDHDDLKSEAPWHQEPSGEADQPTLHDVWSLMYRLQK